MRLVDLVHMVLRMGEGVCQHPVVGEEQKPGRVGVETPHVDERRVVHAIHQLEDRVLCMGVGRARHVSGRLVQHKIGMLGGQLDCRAVQLHHIGAGRHLCRQLQCHFPVHPHASGRNQLLGLAAALCRARACQKAVQAHRRAVCVLAQAAPSTSLASVSTPGMSTSTFSVIACPTISAMAAGSSSRASSPKSTSSTAGRPSSSVTCT